jgi:hypothetical protein
MRPEIIAVREHAVYYVRVAVLVEALAGGVGAIALQGSIGICNSLHKFESCFRATATRRARGRFTRIAGDCQEYSVLT